jgi:hypothetical protein
VSPPLATVEPAFDEFDPAAWGLSTTATVASAEPPAKPDTEDPTDIQAMQALASEILSPYTSVSEPAADVASLLMDIPVERVPSVPKSESGAFFLGHAGSECLILLRLLVAYALMSHDAPCQISPA